MLFNACVTNIIILKQTNEPEHEPLLHLLVSWSED